MDTRRLNFTLALAVVCGLVWASMAVAQPTLRLGAASNTGGGVAGVINIEEADGVAVTSLTQDSDEDVTVATTAGDITIPGAVTAATDTTGGGGPTWRSEST